MNETAFLQIPFSYNGAQATGNLPSYDLLVNRTVHITGEIDDETYETVSGQLRYLAREDADKPVTIVINSPGGSVSAGKGIIDAMKALSCDVITEATGQACSMAAFILAMGTPGCRFATESTDIMIHQPLAGVTGQVSDIVITARHVNAVKKSLSQQLAIACGKSASILARDMERDNWMSATDALKYGLIDHIGSPSQFKSREEREVPEYD